MNYSNISLRLLQTKKSINKVKFKHKGSIPLLILADGYTKEKETQQDREELLLS